MTEKFLETLGKEPRLLIQAQLEPVQGERFQPTGFPDLGPAFYQLHDRTPMLLVESAQSMANRLETVCWDESGQKLVDELTGMPYVSVDLGTFGKTSTLQEFHRLNSPYIWQGNTDETGQRFREGFSAEAGIIKMVKKSKGSKQKGENDEKDVPGVLDIRKLARAAFKYDPNSVIHGLFLEKVSGRLRLTRALTAFIEARNVSVVESGGVKFDRVFPSPKGVGTEGMKLDAATGFGNVPFHRSEYTAEKIVAYFNLDLGLLRGYGLPEQATAFLVCLALFKIQRFLAEGLRLRTACDLITVGPPTVNSPLSFQLPDETQLIPIVASSLQDCMEQGLFAKPPVTRMMWKPGKQDQSETDAAESTDD